MESLMQYFGFLCLMLVTETVTGAQLSANEDQVAVFGNTPATLTCEFTTEADEVRQSVTIQHRRYSNSGWSELFSFNLLANRSLYSEPDLVNRTLLFQSARSVSVTYRNIECSDNGTYQCVLGFAKGGVMAYARDSMQLIVEAEAGPPVMSGGNVSDFNEYDSVQYSCSAYVGTSPGRIAWFGVRDGQSPVELTALADQSPPTQDNRGPRFCIYRRSSDLEVNLTRNHNGMHFRCVVTHATRDLSYSELCSASSCVSSSSLNVQYGIRQEDTAIVTIPSSRDHVFDAGSSVTLQCSVDGNPQPLFTWFKGDNVVHDGGNRLMLEKLTPEDSGSYSCLGNNTVGDVVYKVTSSIMLTVVVTTPTSTSTTDTAVIAGVRSSAEAPVVLADVTIIVIACAASLLVIVLIVVIVCYCCRKGTKGQKAIQQEKANPPRPGSSQMKKTSELSHTEQHRLNNLSDIQKSAAYGQNTVKNTPSENPNGNLYVKWPEDTQEGLRNTHPVQQVVPEFHFISGHSNLSRPRSRNPVVMQDENYELENTRPDILMV